MITTQKKFLELGKIGPNTLKVVSAPTTNTETNLAHLEVLTQSVYQQYDQKQITTTVLQSFILNKDF